jgi:hypothetical protein
MEARWLNRAKLRDGVRGTVPLTFGDGFTVSVTVDTTNPASRFLVLAHERFTAGSEEESYRVYLEHTRPPFGGVRWWFECPRTGRPVTKLYLPRGGHRFLSRQAYGLGYACQRDGRLDRVHRQGMKLYRKLGGDGNWTDGPPAKPKWMRWRTYERELDRFDALTEKLDRVWLVSVQPLLASLDRRKRS